jgi:hypothetical protein
LIAILLVVFEMTVREAKNALAAIGKDVFEVDCGAKLRTNKLREAVERLLKEKGFNAQTKLLQQGVSPCKL